MTAVKICGIKDVANGLVAIDAGADYLGFIFYPPSHRALSADHAARLIADLRAARPTGWQAVGVFVNESIDYVNQVSDGCALDIVQLNGDETPDYVAQVARPVFKAIRLQAGFEATIPSAGAIGATRILLDANVPGQWGGTGKTVAWATIGSAVADGFLAGGLTPDNVEAAIVATRAWGVDVSSGVERDRQKDPNLIVSFIAAVRRADASVSTPLGAGATPGTLR